MRIFLLSPDTGVQNGELEMRACRVLRHYMILSARPGGVINECPVILVSQPDAQQAVSILKKSGIESYTD
jgi:hypothetical protein